MSDKNGELMPSKKYGKSPITNLTKLDSRQLAKSLRNAQELKDKIILDVRCQVVNRLERGFEVKMILETAYRSRGIAKTSIGFIVFETNKYGANGFDVLEIVPFDDKDAIDRNVDNIKRIK